MTLTTTSLDVLYDHYWEAFSQSERHPILDELADRVQIQVGEFSIDFRLAGSSISTERSRWGLEQAEHVADFLFALLEPGDRVWIGTHLFDKVVL